MRRNNPILILALLAVVALTLGITVFASGCGDDSASGYRTAQQVQERDGTGASDRSGKECRGVGRQGNVQATDCDGGCSGYGDCLRANECKGHGDETTDCDGGCNGDCDGTGNADDEPFGSEPICL